MHSTIQQEMEAEEGDMKGSKKVINKEDEVQRDLSLSKNQHRARTGHQPNPPTLKRRRRGREEKPPQEEICVSDTKQRDLPGERDERPEGPTNKTRIKGESLESAHPKTRSNGNKEDCLGKRNKRVLAEEFKELLNKRTKNSRETPEREKRLNRRALQSEGADESGEVRRGGNRRTNLKNQKDRKQWRPCTTEKN